MQPRSVTRLAPGQIMLLALVAALSLGGCAGRVIDAGLNITAVSLLEGAADNVPIAVTIDYDKGARFSDGQVTRVVTVRGEDGREVPGVTVEPVIFPNSNQVVVTFTIASTAPLRPLVIQINESMVLNDVLLGTALYYGYDSFVFHVHASGAPNLAPRLTSITPAAGALNSVVPITFTGENFDATTTVAHSNSTVSLSAPSDITPTSFKADLTIPPTAQTGGVLLRVVTTSGESSQREFIVAHDGNRPLIQALFPNHVEAGTTRELAVNGDDFPDLALLESQAPAVLSFDLPHVGLGDRHNVFVNATAAAGAAEQDVAINVRGTPGISTPSTVRVVPTGFTGPRITALRPSPVRLTVGSRVQFQIQGDGFGDAGISSLQFLRNARTGTVFPIDATVLLPTTAAARNTGVVFDFDLFATPNLGVVQLAVRRADGTTSNVAHVELVAPTGGGSPFVSRAGNPSSGRTSISRGTTKPERIFGNNLKNVLAVEFRSPGVTVDPLTIQEDGGFGGVVDVMVTAAPNAELTGDALTTFRVRTARGWSNPVSYRVVP